MFRILLYGFLIYLAYQFIFHFVIPVYKTTQKIKKGFREMNTNNSSNGQQASSSQNAQTNNRPSREPVGEYIDFEEIK